MLTLGIFQLTHPESLTEAELQDVLENSCIDFEVYKNLSRSKLIELYKRVAMPLPRRQSKGSEGSDTQKHNEGKDCVNEQFRNSISLNGTANMKGDTNEITKTILDSNMRTPKSPINDFQHTSKKIRLNNSNCAIRCNSIEKRGNNGKHDETPKKRQKITWP